MLKVIGDHVHTVFATEGVVVSSLLLVPLQLSLAACFCSLFIVYPAFALTWWSDCSFSKLSFSGPRAASVAMASLSDLVQVSDRGVPNPILNLVSKMRL